MQSFIRHIFYVFHQNSYLFTFFYLLLFLHNSTPINVQFSPHKPISLIPPSTFAPHKKTGNRRLHRPLPAHAFINPVYTGFHNSMPNPIPSHSLKPHPNLQVPLRCHPIKLNHIAPYISPDTGYRALAEHLVSHPVSGL